MNVSRKNDGFHAKIMLRTGLFNIYFVYYIHLILVGNPANMSLVADSCSSELRLLFGMHVHFPFILISSIFQNIPKDDRHELIKCKEYLKEAEARREELDLRIDANRAALFVLRKKGEKNVDRCIASLDMFRTCAAAFQSAKCRCQC